MAADGRVLPWEKLRAAALPLKDFRFRYTQNSDAISVMAGVAGQDLSDFGDTASSGAPVEDQITAFHPLGMNKCPNSAWSRKPPYCQHRPNQ